MENRELYTQIFERTEKKYVIGEDTFEKFLQLCGEKIQPDTYFRSEVISLYFDTPDRRLIQKSLEKPVYKEKLRLRSYGGADEESPVFLELKKKYKGVVYKRRIELTLSKAKEFIKSGVLPGENPQIEKELAYFLEFYKEIGPAMLITCDRISYKGDNGLRITFDKALSYRDSHFEQIGELAGLDKEIFPENGTGVLEIKALRAFPLWLCNILSRLEIYPCSFSKYGAAYLLEEKEKTNLKKQLA
ncbi:MAG: polyphosphate polymerase domain-containing protein [Firmicutes bacterium]|nr:polyphosphate polymerase domain-containing protein [[Eubacterium] siraeum]MCM1488835.1 polyphosphate polymerase domain-containing protein [Bacillota bacterium]